MQNMLSWKKVVSREWLVFDNPYSTFLKVIDIGFFLDLFLDPRVDGESIDSFDMVGFRGFTISFLHVFGEH